MTCSVVLAQQRDRAQQTSCPEKMINKVTKLDSFAQVVGFFI